MGEASFSRAAARWGESLVADMLAVVVSYTRLVATARG